jgi:cobalt/nickel transport system permease protein
MLNHEPVNPAAYIQKTDPRVRIVVAVYFSFVTAIMSDFIPLLVLLGISLILVCFSGIKIIDVVRKLLFVQGFILFLWVIIPLSYEGQVLYNIGFLPIYRPGVVLCALITLKSNTILLVFLSLIVSMPLSMLGSSLRVLAVPEKLVHLLLLSYRYIFVFAEEYQRLTRSAMLRGFNAGTNRHTYTTVANIIGMMFVRANERAERVHHAMVCRGFKGRFYTLDSFAIKIRDYIWGGTLVLIPTVLLLLTFFFEPAHRSIFYFFPGLYS